MRVFRRRRGARRHSADGTPGIAGLPRAARALLGALPGVAAVVALFLCAHGVENAADTWMGTSYGRWDGDTLVVTTLAQSPGEYKAPKGEMISDSVTWLDRAGNYLSNTSTVVERFRKIDNDHIAYTATIEDPELYTQPWTVSLTLYRHTEPNAQLLEFRCVPFSEMMLYGDLLEESAAGSASEAAE